MSITAVILAGGRSRRMGTPKALLSIDGTHLMDRTRGVLEGLAPKVCRVLVSGWGEESIPDLKAFQGPVGGILSSARYCLGEETATDAGLLVVPVDLPLLTAESLRPMVDHFVNHPDQAVCYDTNWLPAIFPLNETLVSLCEQSRSVYDLLKNLRFVALAPPSDVQALSNANTPEQWAQLTGSPP